MVTVRLRHKKSADILGLSALEVFYYLHNQINE